MARRDLLLVIAVAAVLSFLPHGSHSFYLPGMYPLAHPVNKELSIKVNSLTSTSTGLPFNYYSLPFCKPLDGIKPAKENFGELLVGDMIENSAYKLKMKIHQDSVLACESEPLSQKQVEDLKSRIDDNYRVNLLLDNLPVTMNDIEKNPGNIMTGVPIGYSKDQNYYIYNHLIFKILNHQYKEPSTPLTAFAIGDSASDMIAADKSVHSNITGYLVVGFESIPCSVQRKARGWDRYSELPGVDCASAIPQIIEEGAKISFTYDVYWENSPIAWASRWDAYLKMNGEQVHWFSILNSLMVISFLAGMVLVILLRSVHRDLAKMEQMDKEEAAQMADESGWKLVVGDVFRAPSFPGLLCIVVGNGVQIICMAGVTIFFAALGFMSPASRGALLIGVILVYVMLGFVAGYVAARLWVALTGLPGGKVPLALKVACFFPGFSAITLMFLNSLIWSTGSTGAMPFGVFFELFVIWFMISVPLTIVGSHYGMKAERIQYPVRTNQIPRQIPPQRYPAWVLILGGGVLPFGTLYIELFFIMSSIWMDRVYYGFGFLFIVLILLIIVCAEVAVVFTYLQLTMEEYRWWWRSFFASGSVALYIFIYSINYLIVDLHQMSGALSEVVFLGYSLLMTVAIFLATGSVGFLASAYFVYYIFSSVKLD